MFVCKYIKIYSRCKQLFHLTLIPRSYCIYNYYEIKKYIIRSGNKSSILFIILTRTICKTLAIMAMRFIISPIERLKVQPKQRSSFLFMKPKTELFNNYLIKLIFRRKI